MIVIVSRLDIIQCYLKGAAVACWTIKQLNKEKSNTFYLVGTKIKLIFLSKINYSLVNSIRFVILMSNDYASLRHKFNFY